MCSHTRAAGPRRSPVYGSARTRARLDRDSPNPNKTLRPPTLDTRDREVYLYGVLETGCVPRQIERSPVTVARSCPVDVERSRQARIRAGSLRSRSTGNLECPWHACFRRPVATVSARACVRPGRSEADGRSSPSATHQRRPRRLAVDGAPTADFSVNACLAGATALLRRHDDARVRSPFWRRQGVGCGPQRGHLLLGEQHAGPQSGRSLKQVHPDSGMVVRCNNFCELCTPERGGNFSGLLRSIESSLKSNAAHI